jgi:hypothetical protein
MAVRSSDGLPPVKNTGRKTGDARDLAANEVGLGSGSDVNPGEKHQGRKTGAARDLAKGRKSSLNGKSAGGEKHHMQPTGKARDLAAKRVAEWRRQT